ncbi:MAG: LCP family protein [Streptosporangiaceae bacterium]|jgi:LCP family protein required for cell wall assembly
MSDHDDSASGEYREPGWMAGSGSRAAPGAKPGRRPGGPGRRQAGPSREPAQPVTGPGQQGDLPAPRPGYYPAGKPPPREARRRAAPSAAQQRLITRIAAGRKARHRRVMLIVSALLSAGVLFVAGTAWGFTSYINDTIGRVNAGTAGTPASGPLNVLLAGVDQRSGLTRHQQLALHVGRAVSSNSDTMMLIHVSGDRSRVTVISLPRDSWVDIPGHGMNKINAAYGLGGPPLVVKTVEQNTGLTINDFIQVNFLGFVKVIDALGGVNICLPFAVDDSYSGLHLSKGLHHVNGITALEYARDRHSFAASDLARIQDQQRLLSSMLTEAISSGTLANPVKLDQFLRAALSAIKVDQGLNVAALADQLRGISPHDVRFMTVPLSNYNYQTPTGQLAVLWDARESQALFSELKNDRPATKPTSGHARTASPKLHRSQVPVAIWNGTLIGGLSATTGADLSKLGFPVQAGLTWPVDDISQTAIQYPPGDLAGARLVRKVVPGASLQQVKGLSKVRIVLGTNGYSVISGTTTPNPAASSSGVASSTAAQFACH